MGPSPSTSPEGPGSPPNRTQVVSLDWQVVKHAHRDRLLFLLLCCRTILQRRHLLPLGFLLVSWPLLLLLPVFLLLVPGRLLKQSLGSGPMSHRGRYPVIIPSPHTTWWGDLRGTDRIAKPGIAQVTTVGRGQSWKTLEPWA